MKNDAGPARFPSRDATQSGSEKPAGANPARDVSRPRSVAAVAFAAAKAWLAHRASSRGAALALYTLLSLGPMLILVLAVAGLFADSAALQANLLAQVNAMVGQQGSDAVKAILSASNQTHDSLVAEAVSAVVVLISATTAFSELKESLDELWGVSKNEAQGVWGLIQERLLSVGLLLVLALMLMISLGVSAALDTISSAVGDFAGTIVGKAGADCFAFAVITGLFAFIFKFLPATRIRWSDVGIGSLVTAALFLVGKLAIGFYLSHGGLGSGYGAAGAVIGLVLWVYYSAQVFFYGALFTHEYAVHIGSRRTAGH